MFSVLFSIIFENNEKSKISKLLPPFIFIIFNGSKILLKLREEIVTRVEHHTRKKWWPFHFYVK